ncbi:MAG: Transferase hexapeptide repeat containing protein [Parcubacteria group bacterium GW2011_GWA2_51_10]|nr:MAG: Transferase hexapeptide repeat containing protein [Parcubacteria group bacterium GW2011_GWA2_51_10]
MQEQRSAKWKPPVIRKDGSTKYGWQVHPRHKKKLTIGVRVDIGFGTYIQPEAGVTIGDGAQIGSHCSIYSVSTIDDKRGAVSIGKGAKIGTHSSIMPGVTVGDGAVVGAHSFVKSDVPPHTLAFGVPARVRRKK